MQEALDNLDEIFDLTKSLQSNLDDKKAISEVMLACERIIPYARSSTPPSIARLCEAMALIFEKFLMESTTGAESGVELALKGAKLVKSAIKSEKVSAELSEEADQLTNELIKNFSLDLIATPTQPEQDRTADTQEENDSADGNSENDFFAEMESDSYQSEREERINAEEEKPDESSPLAQKIEAIAGDFTMLDPDFTDKKAVADMMMEFESLSLELGEAAAPKTLVMLAGVLGGVFEKSLMKGLKDDQKGFDLVSLGIKALTSYLGSAETTEDIVERAEALIKTISDELDVDAPAISEEDSPKTEPAKENDVNRPEDEKGSKVTPAGVDTIKVASNDDWIIYNEFAQETNDTIHALEMDLLELENDPTNEELINNLFRAFHSLKGAAGFLGVTTINVLCHENETLLDKLRKGNFLCSKAMIDVFLSSVDVISAVNEGLDEQCQKVKDELPDAVIETPRFNIENLLDVLSTLSNKPPDDDVVDGEPPKLGELLLGRNLITENQLETALNAQKPIGEVLVGMGAVDSKAVGDALETQALKKRKSHAMSLKVDTGKLDSLLELVGELVITQSIILQDQVLQEEINKELGKNISNLGKITRNIQDHVMNLRMVPLKQTFQKISRLVRDLSKKMKKEVLFSSTGDETEVDKTLIEELNDPLVHLIRNAMDHGVETKEERIAAGKEPMGHVKLSACHRGGNVHIEISDDGKGLDGERILKKAIEKGFASPDDEFSEQEVYNLIFKPGFSTHKVATDISGRGVGMDVVRSNIDKLGGKVEIYSKLGTGSTFTIKLPLTMAIVDGMVVQIGENRFIVPTISIRESIRPRADEVSTVQREGEILNVRGHILPLVRLHNILNIKNPRHTHPSKGLVIIVESDEKDYGLLVDDLLGQQQVVIKSLGKRFKGLPGISGSTILGDGRIGLILDVSGIVCMN